MLPSKVNPISARPQLLSTHLEKAASSRLQGNINAALCGGSSFSTGLIAPTLVKLTTTRFRVSDFNTRAGAEFCELVRNSLAGQKLRPADNMEMKPCFSR